MCLLTHRVISINLPVNQIGVWKVVARSMLIVGLFSLFFEATVHLRGDEKQPSEVREKLERLEREVQDLKRTLEEKGAKNRGEKPAGEDQKESVILLMENAALAPMQSGETTSPRMLVLKLSAANLSQQPQQVDRKNLRLVVDGVEHELQDVPETMKNTSFPWGMEFNYLQRVSPFQSLRLPAGGSSSGWIYVPDLPAGTQPLSLDLIWKTQDQQQHLDLMEAARTRMDLTVDRIGPKGTLGLLTIRGEMNTLAAGVLVQELDKLAQNQVSRVVIAWDSTASPVEPQLANWLRMVAEFEDRSHAASLPFPAVAAAIQVVHLAALPSPDFQANQSESSRLLGRVRVHEDAATAVRLALSDVLERVSREELLKLIESDHPMGKSAALAIGSSRLLAEDLPLVLQAADASDVVIQEGALRGLQHFGEPAAVEKLVFWLRKENQPLSSVAALSLATSRFPAGQDALIELLKNEPVESQEKILSLLMQNPRPLIAEPLYQFLTQHPEKMNPDLLKGLELVGHPHLTELMHRALLSDREDVSGEALRILIARNTNEADEMAVNWVLNELKSKPPTELMLTLLNRVKDQRAVPYLVRALGNSSDSAKLVETLGLIADPSVAPRMLEAYPRLQSGSQAELLLIFKNWEIPEFRELAHQALASEDPLKVRNAAVGLIEGKGDRGLPWIAEVLEQSRQPETIRTLTDVLAGLGDAEAKKILQKVRGSESELNRMLAMGALAQIRTRSPGYSLMAQGLGAAESKAYQEAIGYFTQAIKLDGELFEAYVGRGNCRIKINQLQESGPDFQKALEIEPFSGEALTGYCVSLAVEGKWEESLKRLEGGAPLFEKDINFQYNSACVYGRIVEFLKNHPEVPDRDARIANFTQVAMVKLRQAKELGFTDLNWMREDPDLKPFQGVDEFQKLLKDPVSETPPAEENTEPTPIETAPSV